jgi:hypothetical protein
VIVAAKIFKVTFVSVGLQEWKSRCPLACLAWTFRKGGSPAGGLSAAEIQSSWSSSCRKQGSRMGMGRSEWLPRERPSEAMKQNWLKLLSGGVHFAVGLEMLHTQWRLHLRKQTRCWGWYPCQWGLPACVVREVKEWPNVATLESWSFEMVHLHFCPCHICSRFPRGFYQTVHLRKHVMCRSYNAKKHDWRFDRAIQLGFAMPPMVVTTRYCDNLWYQVWCSLSVVLQSHMHKDCWSM